MKKILLSAYACEPNKGSEPGVGWEWSSSSVSVAMMFMSLLELIIDLSLTNIFALV